MTLPSLEQIPELEVAYDTPLAKYTVARLGGHGDIVAVANSTDALAAAAHYARQNGIPWIILGGGANVLLSDAGVRGLVIINRAKRVQIDADSGAVHADSGVSLIRLTRDCMKQGLKGLEWGISVPGTIGGAVVNNAGAHGADMASNLHSAEILDLQQQVRRSWTLTEMDYDYRHSALKGIRGRYVVLSAMLQLEPGHSPATLLAEADHFSEYRKKTQPPGASLGSMFKNPPGDYAGRLIEAAGLKGYRIGGVHVSPVHANFFVNDEGATAQDYDALIQHVQAVVLKQFGVALELEIERQGEGFSS